MNIKFVSVPDKPNETQVFVGDETEFYFLLTQGSNENAPDATNTDWTLLSPADDVIRFFAVGFGEAQEKAIEEIKIWEG